MVAISGVSKVRATGTVVEAESGKPNPFSPPAREGWSPRKITIPLGKEKEEVDAVGLKLFAVHPIVGRRPESWGEAEIALTHVPTGLALCVGNSVPDLQRIAEFLWDRTRIALQQSTAEKVVAGWPPWVKPWLRACAASCKWVEPKPYLSGEKK